MTSSYRPLKWYIVRESLVDMHSRRCQQVLEQGQVRAVWQWPAARSAAAAVSGELSWCSGVRQSGAVEQLRMRADERQEECATVARDGSGGGRRESCSARRRRNGAVQRVRPHHFCCSHLLAPLAGRRELVEGSACFTVWTAGYMM